MLQRTAREAEVQERNKRPREAAYLVECCFFVLSTIFVQVPIASVLRSDGRVNKKIWANVSSVASHLSSRFTIRLTSF